LWELSWISNRQTIRHAWHEPRAAYFNPLAAGGSLRAGADRGQPRPALGPALGQNISGQPDRIQPVTAGTAGGDASRPLP